MPGSSPDGGRMMRGLVVPIAAPPAASVRPSGRTGCAPPCNDCAWPLAMFGDHAWPARATLVAAAHGGGQRPGIQLAVGPQPLRLRNHNFGLAHQIMVKRLATSPHDPLGITDSACKNQLVVVSVQYGPFNTYIPIRSTTIGKSRVARDPIAMHTSWRSNSDIASVTRASMTFRVVRTNQYNQDLGLIHSTNGNHLESPNEGSSIDHQVTIHLHAQNVTMFPTNETWYFTSQMLVSSSGGLILILTAQSTRNEFRMHSDY
ncbi:triacylglycerol lipase [Dorcoceras hygrometricum]|uniref:Triacylglycerol lipase n=1 Tax=Dorcoceras hygrometricum TaxID=472368 RepID=A0A2Z7AYQ3_9LAMI|nr:triacylglycerol lipase [Dorcoceras hygrometricum]